MIRYFSTENIPYFLKHKETSSEQLTVNYEQRQQFTYVTYYFTIKSFPKFYKAN